MSRKTFKGQLKSGSFWTAADQVERAPERCGPDAAFRLEGMSPNQDETHLPPEVRRVVIALKLLRRGKLIRYRMPIQSVTCQRATIPPRTQATLEALSIGASLRFASHWLLRHVLQSRSLSSRLPWHRSPYFSACCFFVSFGVGRPSSTWYVRAAWRLKQPNMLPFKLSVRDQR